MYKKTAHTPILLLRYEITPVTIYLVYTWLQLASSFIFLYNILCIKQNYYTLNSLIRFWLVESAQWIFKISARDVMTVDYTIIMSRTIKARGNQSCLVRARCVASRQWRSKNMTHVYVRSMYNKTVIRFSCCDIQNNQGLGKDYQPQLAAFGGW